MENIRELKTKDEHRQFINLAKYCFNDTTGWTENIFPLEKQDHSWGIFKGKKLVAGINSLKFQTYAFNSIFPMSGISAVISAPENRNKGYIKKILNHIIKEESEAGTIFSTLRPFSFPFYAKFGYGYCKGYHSVKIPINQLNLKTKPPGEFQEFTHTQKELDLYYDLYDKWVAQYSLGIKSRRKNLKAFQKMLEFSKQSFYLYYKNNTLKSAIIYSFKNIKMHHNNLIINRCIYEEPENLLALLYFIASHRDQCQDALWKTCRSIPVHLFTKTPRISINPIQEVMLRILDVYTILKAKAKQNPVSTKLSFTIEDPLLPKNNGFYIIEGDEVTKKSANAQAKDLISIELLSSLTFNGIDLEEARLAGLVKDHPDTAAEDFFKKDKPLFLTELF